MLEITSKLTKSSSSLGDRKDGIQSLSTNSERDSDKPGIVTNKVKKHRDKKTAKQSSKMSASGSADNRNMNIKQGSNLHVKNTKPVSKAIYKDPVAAFDENGIRPKTSTIRKAMAFEEEKKNFLKTNSNDTDTIDSASSIVNTSMNSEKEKSETIASLVDESADSYEEDFEEYESDFEDSGTESIKDHSSSNSETDNVQVRSAGIRINDTVTQDSSGIIKHPTIVKQQISEPPKIVQKNARTEFLRMSARSTTFLVSEPNDTAPPVSSMQTSHSFINFAAAVQEQGKKKLCNKVMKRGMDLLELIELDEMSYEILEIPPMQYETFIKSFGKSNSKQMCIQTENAEEEVQTDEIDTYDKWTQHPSYDNSGVGGDLLHGVTSVEDWHVHFKTHGVQLHKFLKNVIPVLIALLNESVSHTNMKLLTNPKEGMVFSQGYFRFEPVPACEGSPVIYTCYSPGPAVYLLSVHCASELPLSVPIAKQKGIICIWNVYDQQKPEFVLTSNSQPTCACFGPNGSDTVIAGMADGSLMVWDLTESPALHKICRFEGFEFPLLSPTFISAAVRGESHHSCVVSVQALQHSKRKPYSLKSKQSGCKDVGETYRVLSLEDMGVLNIWLLVEIKQPDPSGSESDAGLAPGGRIKLVKSLSVILSDHRFLPEYLRSDIRTFDFQILHTDSIHILITTDIEFVLHSTLDGQNAVPKNYSCKTGFPVEIRCISCSEHNEGYFLVGGNDGSAMLFKLQKSSPLRTIYQAALGESVTCIQWSTTQPSVFYTLGSLSSFNIWDLSQSVFAPQFTYTFTSSKIMWFTLHDFRKGKSKSKNDVPTQLAFAMEDGNIEVHNLHWKFDAISEQEYHRQLKFMQLL